MLQYLIILLDDTSVSYCHYINPKTKRRLITLEHLKAGILFAMKQNLMIQFVYPDYELPDEYIKVIETIDHNKIKPVSAHCEGDVIVCDDWDIFATTRFIVPKQVLVLQTTKDELFSHYKSIIPVLKQLGRLNIVILDIEMFSREDFNIYKEILVKLTEAVRICFEKGLSPQLNLLTDRMMLQKMNNCNAGDENITLAPNGNFYVCPAFYLMDETDVVGSLGEGVDIKNKQLYKLPYASICKNCDAYQCKRCVWLNRKTTGEVNTPSHQQCVVSHLERNASRELLAGVRTLGEFLPEMEINEIDYLDPIKMIVV